MKLQAKKKVNGKDIVFVDSGTANIEEIAKVMAQHGWTFDVLKATYTAKDGTSKKKDIPYDKLVAIQRKFNLNNWSVQASKGAKVIAFQMDNAKHRIAVARSTGGAIQEFLKLPVGIPEPEPAPVPKPASKPVQKGAGAAGAVNKPSPTQKPIQSSQFQQERAYAEEAAAAALYADNGSNIPEITPVQKEARRAAVRKDDQAKVKIAQKDKHTLLLVFSILEIFTAGIAFGILALIDTLKGRKLSATDPGEAIRRFREAKVLLVFGVIASVLAVVAWNLPALLH